jgi:hypothetical protein
VDYAALNEMADYGLFALCEQGDAADEVTYLGRVMLGDAYQIL